MGGCVLTSTVPQPPNRSFRQPNQILATPTCASADAHMIHGSHVTYLIGMATHTQPRQQPKVVNNFQNEKENCRTTAGATKASC